MKRLINILLICIFAFSLNAQDKILPVPHVYQVDLHNWCWAAAINSIVNYYGYDAELCDVLEAARELDTQKFGDVPCCSNTNVCHFANYALSGNSSMIKVLLHWNIMASSGNPSARDYLSFDAVKYNINVRKPILAIRKYPTTLHALVIIGYNASTREIIYLDPAIDITTLADISKIILRERYETFVNGSGYQWYNYMSLTTTPPQYSNNVMTLSGPNIVCSNAAAFTVNNLPSGCKVYWYKSPNLTYISGQNTNHYTVKSTNKGIGWVRATVPCSRFALPDKSVTVGVSPYISHVSGPQSSIVGATTSYYATVPNASVTSYDWTLVPSVFNNYLMPSGNRCNVRWNRPGAYALKVTARNNCPESSSYYYGLVVGGSSYLSVSPNPASSNIKVSVMKSQSSSAMSDSPSITDSKRLKSSSNDLGSTYNIRIYNYAGKLFYSAKKTGKDFLIPVNQLMNGTYIVEVNDGKESIKQHLVVKH